MGNEVTLDEIPTRVVALSAADCEVLFAIGAGDALVGRGEYCDYPEEVLSVPSVQSGYETNIESIIALEPPARNNEFDGANRGSGEGLERRRHSSCHERRH